MSYSEESIAKSFSRLHLAPIGLYVRLFIPIIRIPGVCFEIMIQLISS
jgi:hypothetical protein